jgi:hypothetical protein
MRGDSSQNRFGRTWCEYGSEPPSDSASLTCWRAVPVRPARERWLNHDLALCEMFGHRSCEHRAALASRP